MSREKEMRVEAAPGVITIRYEAEERALAGRGAGGSGGGGLTAAVSYAADIWPQAKRMDTLLRLTDRPDELYALLRGRAPEWLHGAGLVPAAAELRRGPLQPAAAHEPAERGRGGQGQDAPEAAAAAEEPQESSVREAALSLLAEQPLLALAVRGIPREELLGGVFTAWAECARADEAVTGRAASGGLAGDLARLERKGPAAAAGEWLAEAAAEGALHQPGPELHELQPRPISREPDIRPPDPAWARLLPNTPRAQEGMALLMRRVAEAAAARAGAPAGKQTPGRPVR